MQEIKKEDVKQEVFDLYDDYAHNRVNRRDFIERLSTYAVGGLTVASLMSFLMPDYKNAIQIRADDPRLKTEYINYKSEKGGGTIKALLSMPADTKKKLGGIVVVHENRGLNPHIEDVARRAALAGFISLAPDALTPLGGYPGNDDAGRELQSKRDRNEMLEDFIAAYDYLKSNKDCNGKVGVDRQYDGCANSRLVCRRSILWWPARKRRRAENQGSTPFALWRTGYWC
jgi:carboxymethylenebutenolidase